MTGTSVTPCTLRLRKLLRWTVAAALFTTAACTKSPSGSESRTTGEDSEARYPASGQPEVSADGSDDGSAGRDPLEATMALLARSRATVPYPRTAADGTPVASPASEVKRILFPVYDPQLSERKETQLAALDQFHVFHDFQFTDIQPESGITFQHQIVDDAGRSHVAAHYDHGNGVAVADVDGDGLLDVYFVNQAGSNELWRNLGGGRFENITDKAGVAAGSAVGVSASFVDIDNDGDADLYVTVVRGRNFLFENDGTGVFTDISEHSGLDYYGHSSAAVFFDFDRDGLLDVLVTEVGVFTTESVGRGGYFIAEKAAFAGHLYPAKNKPGILFRNLGGNRFRNVNDEMEFNDLSWTGDAVWLDANDDGWPDLYLLNMQGHDEYWENVAGTRFIRKSREIFPATPWGTMGAKVFDFNNDGRLDLFLTDMHTDMVEMVSIEREQEKMSRLYPSALLATDGNHVLGNAFFRNEGNYRFSEISDEIGAENYWPWGISVGDLNANGWQDVFITACMNYPYGYGVNSLLLNNRGERFLDSAFILGVEPRRGGRTAFPWFTLDCGGADRGHRHCEDQDGIIEVWGSIGSRSSVIFDLDDDGDLDIVTNDFGSEPQILLSNLTERRMIRFLKVTLKGSQSNRDGIGAIVTVRAGKTQLVQQHDGKSGYLSQSRLPLYFGLGDTEQVDAIEIAWPSGIKQHVAGPIAAGQLLVIEEPP